MALPRPVLIALLGLALVAAAFLATRSASDTGGAATSTATPAPAHKATPAPAKPARKHAAPPAKTAAPAGTHTATPASPGKLVASSPERKKLRAIKALGRGDVVVFFFTRPGPADDTATRQAVNGLKHERHLTVITAGYADLETYRPVLSGASVSQLPAIVVVKGGAKGRLLEGFVDPTTLRQTVADARR